MVVAMTLHDGDEGLHDPPSPLPGNWQENLFFICWDTTTATGLVVHLQRVPGADVQAAQVAVAVDGAFASATFTAPVPARGARARGARRTGRPVAAMDHPLEGKAAAGAGPLGFFANRPGGDTPITADVTLESTLPVADFAAGLAAVVDGMRADRRGPQMGDQQHYEQGGAWRGRLRVGDRERSTAGLFVRDHSWGIRHEHSDFTAFWTASCLDEGRLFCNAIGIPRGDRVIGIGMVVDESGVRSTTSVAADFQPATRDRRLRPHHRRIRRPARAHPLRRDAMPRSDPPSPLRPEPVRQQRPVPGPPRGRRGFRRHGMGRRPHRHRGGATRSRSPAVTGARRRAGGNGHRLPRGRGCRRLRHAGEGGRGERRGERPTGRDRRRLAVPPASDSRVVGRHHGRTGARAPPAGRRTAPPLAVPPPPPRRRTTPRPAGGAATPSPRAGTDKAAPAGGIEPDPGGRRCSGGRRRRPARPVAGTRQPGLPRAVRPTRHRFGRHVVGPGRPERDRRAVRPPGLGGGHQRRRRTGRSPGAARDGRRRHRPRPPPGPRPGTRRAPGRRRLRLQRRRLLGPRRRQLPRTAEDPGRRAGRAPSRGT